MGTEAQILRGPSERIVKQRTVPLSQGSVGHLPANTHHPWLTMSLTFPTSLERGQAQFHGQRILSVTAYKKVSMADVRGAFGEAKELQTGHQEHLVQLDCLVLVFVF